MSDEVKEMKPQTPNTPRANCLTGKKVGDSVKVDCEGHKHNGKSGTIKAIGKGMASAEFPPPRPFTVSHPDGDFEVMEHEIAKD